MDLLPFIISGLTVGSIYGLAGVGLVLTYKTSGIFNLAHGALATVTAYAFYTMNVEHHVQWPVAAGICLLVLCPVLGLLMELVARAVGHAALATKVAATVGLLLVVQGAVPLLYGETINQRVPQFLPHGVVHLGSTVVTADKLIITAIALASTIGLSVMFRTARLGLAMRAVVEDPALLSIEGTSPVVVRRSAWMTGVVFAGLSGLLLAPLIQLDSTTLTLLVVQAFGAAALGAFSSLPLTFGGGLAIGVGSSLATKYFTTGVLAGLPTALPFLVLFAVLLLSPKRRLASPVLSQARGHSTWSAPGRVQLVGALAVLVTLALVPAFADVHLTDWTLFLCTSMVLLSLGLLVRTSGQVSLCHISFMAIGAAAFSHLTVDQHLPWLLALVLSGLIAMPIGAVLAIPAIRLSGLYLALATLGFGILLSYMFYSADWMFGSFGQGLAEPRPHVSFVDVSSDKGYYFLVLCIVSAVTASIALLGRSRLGRLLRAMSDSPLGLSTSGAAVAVTQVLVFCLSAALAAVGGALGAVASSSASPDSYQPLASLSLFVLVVIGVGSEPWYALIAAAGFSVIPSYVTGAQTGNWLTLAFGAAAIAVAVTPAHRRGLPAAIRRALTPEDSSKALHAVPSSARPEKVQPGALVVEGLTVRFGGVVAVDGVSLEAPTARITGLIGPNGAGKTTTFNACSGLNSPQSGLIRLDGRDITRLGASARARRGLGRTFQQMELFDSLSVRANVAMGHEGSFASLNAVRHVIGSVRERRAVAEATADAMHLCGVAALANRTVGSLSTGQRRLVELARCLAGRQRILLLDEPSSGLDRSETERFGEILRDVVEERGVGILIVEHDMSLVTAICDHIYVLDFGRSIFDGTPADVLDSPAVRAAYLGVDTPALRQELAP